MHDFEPGITCVGKPKHDLKPEACRIDLYIRFCVLSKFLNIAHGYWRVIELF